MAHRFKVKQEYIISLICALLVGTMVIYSPKLFGAHLIAYYFIFYSIGFFLHKYEDLIITKNAYLIASLFVLWSVLAWFWQQHELPSWLHFVPIPASLTQFTYRFVTATIAIYVLIAVSPKLLSSDQPWNKPFVKLGMVSLGIYTTHIVIIRKVISLCGLLNLNETTAIIVSFITALILSWIIVWLLSKWKYTAKYLLGKI